MSAGFPVVVLLIVNGGWSATALAVSSAHRPAVAIAADEDVPSREPLDVYVAAWCGYCRALENDLRARRIPFFAHDIEADPRAKREYDALGGEGLPLTRVGKQVVRGYDLPAILKLLDRAP